MGIQFFLYGVYDEGQNCFSRFKNFITSSQQGTIKGTLCRLGCGLPVLGVEGSDVIHGHLVELEVPDSYLPILDTLNGYIQTSPKKSFLIRKEVEVETSTGFQVLANTYVLNPERSNIAVETIAGDDWIGCGSDLISKLTDRQRTYISKLSRAKGREIIPVDMVLYRELMSLELIVDKGRRLALTKLGQEVSLFL